jgi:hypothetical protein
VVLYLLTELSPSWGTINWAATKELPSTSWNPKVHYRVHKSPPLIPILSNINPVHTTPCCLSKIHFNLWTHLRLGLPKGVFLLTFPPISYMHSFLLIRSTCHAHIIILDLIILIILVEDYKLWSSLCSFLQFSATHLPTVEIFSSTPL